MRLTIRHVTRYVYDPPAHRMALRLKLYPSRFDGQSPRGWSVAVNGAPVAPMFINGLGDGEALWTVLAPKALVEIVAEGEIDTIDRAGLVRGLADQTRPGVFLRETPLTTPDDAIRALAEAAFTETGLAALHKLCGMVRDRIEYVSRATMAETSASEALALGRGVCQDHAHVFIAAARAMGVPARYVTGYLQAEKTGAQETHAWAEAFAPDLGWIGFDPANRQCPTAEYVRLCTGLDAAHAAPVRGCVSPGAGESLSVAVEVAQQ
jgi:transglutaminase-like putative cysteine protease